MSTRKEQESIRLEKKLLECQEKQRNLKNREFPLTDIAECIDCGTGYYKHPIFARSNYCCSCRIKHNIEKRRAIDGTKIDIKPGFPKVEQFKTMQEVETYFSNEKLECLMCGHEFAGLSQHINHIHKISSREYQTKYGIPFGRGLVGSETSKKISAAVIDTMKRYTNEEILEKITYAASKLPLNNGCKNSHSEAVIHMRRKIVLEKVVTSINHISNMAKDRVDVPCSSCGERTSVSTMASITNSCKLLCKKCRTRSNTMSSYKSKAKKPEYYKECRKNYIRKK